MSNSIWSEPLSSVGSQSNSSLQSSYANSDLDIAIDPKSINTQVGKAHETLYDTLVLSKATNRQYKNVNMELAQIVSDQLSKIQKSKADVADRLKSLKMNAGIATWGALEGLLKRYKIVEKKLLLRQASIRAVLKAGNEYFRYSNIGEFADMAEDSHNRYLVLQKEIHGSNHLEDKLDNLAKLLDKFVSLSSHGINAAAASHSYESSLERIEREEIIEDTLRQIRHVSEQIKKAKEEPITEITNSESYSSTSLDSFSGEL